jgi:hypothetical protein
MVYLSEWLPNPASSSTANEFVELFNSGNAPVDLRGWTLANQSQKRARLGGMVPADGYLVFYRAQTKLVLRNSDGGIALYDAKGQLVDQSSFVGSALKGKSFNRIANPSGPSGRLPLAGEEIAQNFAWGEPTPGAANKVSISSAVAGTSEPIGVPLNPPALGAGGFVAALLGLSMLLAALILYSIKVNAHLSDLFFGGDETLGQASGKWRVASGE